MSNLTNPAVLKGRLLDAAGRPLSGKITIRPDTKIITSTSLTMTDHGIDVDLDAYGAFRQELQGNDAADVTPQGFTYRVSFELHDHDREAHFVAPFSFAIGAGQTRDIRDLAPITPNSGNPVTSGPAGKDGTPGAPGTPGSASVKVVDGTEARPNVALVFWIGGSTQPSNMGLDDLWFAAPALPDTTAPSIPAGLAATDVTQTGFTLTWTASTDEAGVVGYDIFLGGVLKASTSGATTAALAGLYSGTAYSVTVKARDAAGNVSAASAVLSVTTLAGAGSPRHSIWGGGNYPYTVTKYTESGPITVANSFYSYGTSPDVSAWRVVGARVWIPAGVTISGPADVKAFLGGVNPDFSVTAAASGTITEWVSGAWNEVIFPTPVETTPGDPVWISYRLGNGDYFAALHTEIGAGFVAASDGSHIVLSDDNGTTQRRSAYRLDGQATQLAAANGYSIDVIFDEGP